MTEFAHDASWWVFWIGFVFMLFAGLKVFTRVNVDWKSLAWAFILLAFGLSRV